MSILEITDDSGFIGIANFDKYESFISEDWEFEDIKRRIIEETNSHNLLFWATGLENTWKVVITDKSSDLDSYREEKGVIEVTNQRLYLTNYESLTMAAQFEDIKLPESHLQDLFVELENGKYMVEFRQMFNPDEFEFDPEQVNFEVVIQKIINNPALYNNKVNGIYWSNY